MKRTLTKLPINPSDRIAQRIVTNSSYNGNKSLKGCGVYHEFNPGKIEEIRKCKKSCSYFISNYMKIVTLDEGLKLFEPYDYQKKIVEVVQDNNHVIIKSSRQSGKTTVIAGIILWNVIFKSSFVCGVFANKAKNARGVLKRVQVAYMNLPKWLQQGVVTWNLGDIELENNSKIITSSTTVDSGRSESLSMIYLDEFAFVPRQVQHDFWKSVYPTISSGKSSKVLITSTPRGLEMFYKLWTEAVDGTNDYIPIDVLWSDIPGRDEAWKQKTIKNTSIESFRSEFETQFLGSSDTLINASTLGSIPTINPIEKGKYLNIYKKPQTGHVYVMTCDTARGGGNDYSAFVVIDITKGATWEVVAVYRNNTIPFQLFPTEIVNSAKAYNDAEVLIETNDLGEAVAHICYKKLQYHFITRTRKAGILGVIACGPGYDKAQYGFKTTKSTKGKGTMNLKAMLEQERLIINDIDLLFELTNFVRWRESWKGDNGYNDDIVMCLVFFSWFSDQEFFIQLSGGTFRQIILDKEDKISWDSVVPFQMNNGMDTADELVDLRPQAQGIRHGGDIWFPVNEDDYDEQYF